MSTVIDDEYKFNSLNEWELFYRKNKEAVDRKTTKWLNNHITITDGGKRYRIFYRYHKLYLKPFKQLDTEKVKENIQEHRLVLILKKLEELNEFLTPNFNNRESNRFIAQNIPKSIPNKSLIERIQEIKPNTNETSEK